MPLSHFFVLIANAHPCLVQQTFLLACARRGAEPGHPDRVSPVLPSDRIPANDKTGTRAAGVTFTTPAKMPSTCRSGLVEDHAERSSSRIIRPASRSIRGCAVRQHPPDHRPDESQSLRNALKSLLRSHCQCSSLLGSANLFPSLALEGVLNLAIRTGFPPFFRLDRIPANDKTGTRAAGVTFTTPAKMPSTCRSGLVEDHAERSSSRIIRPASRSIRGCAVRQHPPDHRPDESQSLRNALHFFEMPLSQLRTGLPIPLDRIPANDKTGTRAAWFNPSKNAIDVSIRSR